MPEKYIDYLDEDEPIRGQNFMCISFLSPEGVKNCKIRGLKIRGVYATREEADKRAAELGELDPDFDVFVGEVGKWLPWNPSPEEAEDEVWQEQELNDLMKGYKENQTKTKRMEKQRKRQLLEEAARQDEERATVKTDDDVRNSATKDRLRKKLAERNAKKAAVSEELDTKLINKQTENAKDERERLLKFNKEIEKRKDKISSVNNKLAEIEELYNKLKTGKTLEESNES